MAASDRRSDVVSLRMALHFGDPEDLGAFRLLSVDLIQIWY